jgi:AcrR family transcriptional regulator
MTKASAAAPKRAGRRPPAPRIGRPPGQASEDTRKRILQAARERFAQLGFERATNRDIAALAGLTAAAVYRHFASKPDLYAAVVHDAVSELIPLVRDAAASEGSARKKLQRFVLAASGVDVHRAAGVRFLSAVPTEMRRHPEVARRMLADPGEMYSLLNDLVAAGVHTGEIPGDKAQRLVALMVALLMGFSSYANALGHAQSELAVAGFLDLLDGKLFQPRRRGSR